MAIELTTGEIYRLKIIDREYPVVEPDPDDEFSRIDTGDVEIVFGRKMDVTIFGYPMDGPCFVEVYNHRLNKEHLVHRDSIENAIKF